MNNTFTTIIKPVVTEKSSVAQENGLYTFLVSKKATKIDIKNSVEKLFGVKVESVKTLITPKKVRMIKGKHEMVKRGNLKKAIVRLEKNSTMDPNKLKFDKQDKK